MVSFSKLTPEKLWRAIDQPNWLSVNGGTVNGVLYVAGNATVSGNITTASATTGSATVTGTVTAGSATVTGAVTAGTITSGSINQGRVGFPLFALGPSFAGTILRPIPNGTTCQCTLAMACTAVTASPGYVTFTVNNDYAFAIGQSIYVSNTTNWNGNFQVYSVAATSVTCATPSTFPSEPVVTSLIEPYFDPGVYNVSVCVKFTANSNPTPGSTNEGVAMGFDLGLTAPANYTQTNLQTTSNLINTITSAYGVAALTIAGTIRTVSPLSKFFIVLQTPSGATGTYSANFNQVTVTPIGVYRP